MRKVAVVVGVVGVVGAVFLMTTKQNDSAEVQQQSTNGDRCEIDFDCFDYNNCTEEECKDGTCVVRRIVCDDGDPCTHDRCDVINGCGFVPFTEEDCDDGDDCTNDFCTPGKGCDHSKIPDCS